MNQPVSIKPLLLLLGGILLFGLAGAQDVPATEASADDTVTLLRLFALGGWAMYPLLVFSVGAVGLAIYCAISITTKRFSQPDAVPEIRQRLGENDLEGALGICEARPGYVTNILTVGLETMREGHSSTEVMNEAMAERANKVLAGPLLFVQYLQVIASVAPMVGLLGTVSGMIKAFNNIAAQGMGRPELLANNISEALITTAAGLIVAIPALMAYFYFKNKYSKVSSGIYETLGVITRQITLQSERPSPPHPHTLPDDRLEATPPASAVGAGTPETHGQ